MKYYTNFTYEFINESNKDVERKIKLFFSGRFFKILQIMESPVAVKLIDMYNSGSYAEVTDIDMVDDKGMVDYYTASKYKKKYEEGVSIKKEVTKINRLVNKISEIKNQFKPSDIEQFGNEFKAKLKKENKMFVVYGNDIKKWYNGDLYYRGGGSLSSSCMRSVNSSYFDIYSENDKDNGAYSHIGMLILLDDNDRLRGRAIVWFNSIRPEPGRIFMDRIYYTSESEITLFKDYARKHGWLYKHQQTYGNPVYVDPKDGNKHGLALTFRLKQKNYRYYPYMDTMIFYTPETGRISSKPNKNKTFKTYKLQNQHGRADRVNI